MPRNVFIYQEQNSEKAYHDTQFQFYSLEIETFQASTHANFVLLVGNRYVPSKPRRNFHFLRGTFRAAYDVILVAVTIQIVNIQTVEKIKTIQSVERIPQQRLFLGYNLKKLAYLLYGLVASLPWPSSNIEARRSFAPAFRALGVCGHS